MKFIDLNLEAECELFSEELPGHGEKKGKG
jgi:hypothetical protein